MRRHAPLRPVREVDGVEHDERVQQAADDEKRVAVLVGDRDDVAVPVTEHRGDDARQRHRPLGQPPPGTRAARTVWNGNSRPPNGRPIDEHRDEHDEEDRGLARAARPASGRRRARARRRRRQRRDSLAAGCRRADLSARTASLPDGDMAGQFTRSARASPTPCARARRRSRRRAAAPRRSARRSSLGAMPATRARRVIAVGIAADDQPAEPPDVRSAAAASTTRREQRADMARPRYRPLQRPHTGHCTPAVWNERSGR